MRIDSMDATFRPAVSSSNLEAKADLPFKQNPDTSEPVKLRDKVSDAFIEKAVDKVNHTMQIQNRSLEFKIHEKTNEIIVKIIDTDTKEVIREIPSEKILDMFANMLELAGLLVDERR